MRSAFLASALACALGVSVSADASELPENAIGEVKELDTNAYLRRTGDKVAAKRGSAVYSGDTVETDESGAIGITFIDGTVLSLGSDSTLIIDEMIYDPEAGDLGFTMQVIQGTAGYLSGRIATLSPENVMITTPTSVIGIRGTRVLIRVDN